MAVEKYCNQVQAKFSPLRLENSSQKELKNIVLL